MKNFLLIVIFTLFRLFCYAQQPLPEWVVEMKKPNPDYKLLEEKFEAFWSDKKVYPDESDKKFEEDEFAILESYGWLRQYIRQYRELMIVKPRRNPNYNPNETKLANAAVPTGQWTVAGPKDSIQYMSGVGLPFGIGRVNHLAFSGTNPNVIYAMAPGGLFISSDTGATWNPTGTDFWGYNQYRTVAVDPGNDSIIYIGCGDLMTIPIVPGILKSTDFGTTFTPLTNGMDTTQINVIAIDPSNTGHIIAGGYTGIWTSFDAGDSWQKTMVINTFNNLYDIKFKPGSSDSIYATTANGFFISSDGGTTWNQGFNNFQFTEMNQEQLLLGVTAAAPDYVYIASQQDFGNIYRSTDGGITFTPMKLFVTPGLVGYDINLYSYGQGVYDFTFNADPVNPDKLYIGSISLYESNDGGVTWNTPYYNWSQSSMNNRLHCDQHFVARNPLLPDRIWAANDGGVYMKMDTDTAFVPRMKNLCVTQAYHFDADNFYDSTFAVGTQDNGAYFTNNGTNFYFYKGGDVYGRVYCTYNYNAAIYTWGSNFQAGTNNIDIHTGSGSYPLNVPETDIAEPISMTPFTPLTAFAAFNDIQETNNMNGNPVNWRVIFDNGTTYTFMAINHSLADSNIFFAARSDGYLFRTFNALVNQPTFDSVPLPATTTNPIVSIATVVSNPGVIYACSDQVYKSDDYGVTWNNITGTMNPLYGFQEIVADPYAVDGSVYLAATNKIFYRNDTSSWIDFSLQLPNVSYINDITVKKFSSQVRKVMATILNRSVWESPVMQSLGTGVEATNLPEPEIIMYPVPASTNVNISILSGTSSINQVIIYDERGRQVGITRNGMKESHVRISTEKLSPGVYIVEVVTTEGSVMRKINVSR